MKVRRSFWRALRPFANIKEWTNFSTLKRSAGGITDLAKTAFALKKPTNVENFDDAIKRLKLSPELVEKRKKQFLTLGIIFFIIGLAILVFSLFRERFETILISLVVAALAFGEAFRNHFWYIQMKHRKLGISIREWMQLTFKGKL